MRASAKKLARVACMMGDMGELVGLQSQWHPTGLRGSVSV